VAAPPEGREILATDSRDPFAVRQAVNGCQSVLHLAALIAIPYSYVAPQSYVATNIGGTLNVLEAARDCGVERLVHTSTSEVYGSARFTPMTEAHPLQAQSPYAATKIAADQLALSYHKSFGLPVVVLRPFNTFGPRQSTRAVIPAIITQLAAGAQTLRLGALAPVRDFNFVLDTVAGFIAAESAPGVEGEVLNLCSGHAVSIGETAKLIMEIMGVAARIEQEDARLRPAASEVDRLQGDAALMRARTGWSPRYEGEAGLRAGLADTARWFANPANLALYRAGEYAI